MDAGLRLFLLVGFKNLPICVDGLESVFEFLFDDHQLPSLLCDLLSDGSRIGDGIKDLFGVTTFREGEQLDLVLQNAIAFREPHDLALIRSDGVERTGVRHFCAELKVLLFLCPSLAVAVCNLCDAKEFSPCGFKRFLLQGEKT
ncbi:hypothetical protein HBH56_194700 [Parastagonospora nodorum]|nr:hypothetical protein HBH56_194700 [Parastagonospora nodorum]KAH3924999.1 hypothetical protein HBH54_188800 [Parastagonospora nodorum]KAH4026401.1 hypothetical protein HBI13_061770 [Parastagonospora nodorum]KAH4036465.1 hypothetical protein HBI09_073270 [Parastagonospora nodorum]KAH4102815.1 hypothetical protein HBH46_122350 [Parastagonospora nodorum]